MTCKGQTLAMCPLALVASGQDVTPASRALPSSNWKKLMMFVTHTHTPSPVLETLYVVQFHPIIQTCKTFPILRQGN